MRRPPPAAKLRGRPDGIGRSSSRRAEAVSDAMRRGTGELIERRRRVAALSLVSAAAMGVVSLYQVGLLRHLPDPPLRWLDSDRVDGSGEAYEPLKTPDAALGLASYGVTVALAGMGAEDRAREQPWIPLALAAKVGYDALGAAYLTAEQVSTHRRLCLYCLVASAASLAAVPQVVPELRQALRALGDRLG